MEYQKSFQSTSAQEHRRTQKIKSYWRSGDWCSGARSWLGILLLGFLVCAKPIYASDKCQLCHPAEVETFLKTMHFKDAACVICHGDAGEHLKSEAKKDDIVNPADLSVKKANNICTACHGDKERDVDERFKAMVNLHEDLPCYECHKAHLNSGERNADDADLFGADLAVNCALCHKKQADEFSASRHGLADILCSDCHKLHTVKTISEDIEEQLDKCLSCHPAQELEFKSPYAHPLRERQVKCSDCHNPHGDRFDHMLKEEDDDTCGPCHKDIIIQGGKHPLSKDTNHPFNAVKCMDCHNPHGSNFTKVLKYNIDNICKTCHN